MRQGPSEEGEDKLASLHKDFKRVLLNVLQRRYRASSATTEDTEMHIASQVHAHLAEHTWHQHKEKHAHAWDVGMA